MDPPLPLPPLKGQWTRAAADGVPAKKKTRVARGDSCTSCRVHKVRWCVQRDVHGVGVVVRSNRCEGQGCLWPAFQSTLLPPTAIVPRRSSVIIREVPALCAYVPSPHTHTRRLGQRRQSPMW
jgi:hypothetical protein